MTKIAYDNLKLDSLKIIEDSRCCLKVNAVITKEGVYQYPDGKALKSRVELLRATQTARAAKLTVRDHPDSLVVMSQKQMKGVVEKPFFDKDRIRAVLNFDKAVCSTEFLDGVRRGDLKDVSIGFYYQPDLTPGIWKGKPYDYVMRDILIDHVAAGVFKGRCTYPNCGIGVDTMMRRIALDPFAGYKDFAECVEKNKGKVDDPEAYCATIKAKVEDVALSFRSKSLKGGKNVKKKIDYGHAKSPEEIADEFEECVRQRMAEGADATPPITREQAELLCQPPTEPADEPEPSTEHLDQEELSEWQKCINTKMEGGMSMEEATAKCKEEGIVKGDQDAAYENCVQRLMDEGKSAEEAQKECRTQHPIGEGDQSPEETEPTPLERCVKNRMEQTGETEESATEWCKAELSGEHQAVDTLLENSDKLMKMREERNIERRRANRRHPLSL